MRVAIQIRPSQFIATLFSNESALKEFLAALQQSIPGLRVDFQYGLVRFPKWVRDLKEQALSASPKRALDWDPNNANYILRATVEKESIPIGQANPHVAGIFSDPVIGSTYVCRGDPAVGTVDDVRRLLAVPELERAGMDGTGVYVAVVDTGINVAYLDGYGRRALVDPANSWTPPGVPTLAGGHEIGHGTKCAFQVGVAAPQATLLDYSVLITRNAGIFSALLSDLILAYSNLLNFISGLPSERRNLVVTNSWCMSDPRADLPPEDPGNYSDRLEHPFNTVVSSLESMGADILFAAGNCGRDCPTAECNFADKPICGANSHPQVLTVGAIDINDIRAGYSSQGPGRLMESKPDLVTYSHYEGSRVDPVDGGTSTPCPLAAGVIAAVRSKFSSSALPPAELRSLLCKHARQLGATEFDHDHGWGALDPAALLVALQDLTEPTQPTGPEQSE